MSWVSRFSRSRPTHQNGWPRTQHGEQDTVQEVSARPIAVNCIGQKTELQHQKKTQSRIWRPAKSQPISTSGETMAMPDSKHQAQCRLHHPNIRAPQTLTANKKLAKISTVFAERSSAFIMEWRNYLKKGSDSKKEHNENDNGYMAAGPRPDWRTAKDRSNVNRQCAPRSRSTTGENGRMSVEFVKRSK